MKKWLIRILLIIFIIGLVLSVIYIIKNRIQDKKQNEIFEELENIVTEEKEEKSEEQKEENINLEKLYELNNDFIGWLKINNTNISYPVMQTDCNRKDYYLRKNFYKEYSQLGTPYIAEYCNVQTGDNVIVYGHHITDHQVFGELEKYKKKAFYDNHKVINFNTIYGNADYEIISVFKTVAHTGFKYYEFINSSSQDEFNTFIKKSAQMTKQAVKTTIKAIQVAIKSAISIIKAIILATKALISAIIAGGWVAVVIIVVICLIAMLCTSIFGIFFSNEDEIGEKNKNVTY